MSEWIRVDPDDLAALLRAYKFYLDRRPITKAGSRRYDALEEKLETHRRRKRWPSSSAPVLRCGECEAPVGKGDPSCPTCGAFASRT